jgi:hypothetical protein
MSWIVIKVDCILRFVQEASHRTERSLFPSKKRVSPSSLTSAKLIVSADIS